jgi:predicted transcriptional regulator
LSSNRSVDYSTVQTYIRRLEAKGYITARRVGRNKIYRPKVRPGKVIGEAIDDLMNRLFDGEVLPLMKHLINDRGIDENDLVELRRMLDSAAKDRDEGADDE